MTNCDKQENIKFIVTWFYSGCVRFAPGTIGSLAAIPFALLIALNGPLWLLFTIVIVSLIGVYAADKYIENSENKDPKEVVIDEVVGQWIALFNAPLDWKHYLLGFILFRSFDILKPWPVSWADKKVKGGIGIMLDDIIAGIYALVIMEVVRAYNII